MAGIVKHARLESRTSRARLKRGRQPHWQAISGHAHLGYQRWPEDDAGRWILRRYDGGKYSVQPLGRADDTLQSDGDPAGVLPATIEVVPGAFTLLVPGEFGHPGR